MTMLMRHSRYLYHFALVLAAVLGSCQPRSTNDPESTVEETGFKPNPKKVPKHEVRTLEPGNDAIDFNLPDVSGRFYSLADFADAIAMARGGSGATSLSVEPEKLIESALEIYQNNIK